MIKCFRIHVGGEMLSESSLDGLVRQARKLGIEGSIQQSAEEGIRLVVCGEREKVDAFVDAVHKLFSAPSHDIFVEPFLKDRDYRGVFRIIE